MTRLLRSVFVWPGENRGLLIALWFHVGLALAALIALPFDHRLILGISPWIKPLKFDLSVLIYVATLAILLHLLGGSKVDAGSSTAVGTDGVLHSGDRWQSIRVFLGWGVAISMMVENTIISGQSLRGVASHMNYTSLFNGFAFGVMGVFILVNTVLVAILLAVYLTRMELPEAVAWGIRLGLVRSLPGALKGR